MHRFAAKSMQNIKPSELDIIWAKAAELTAQGKDIVNFGIGRPDFDTPRPIKEKAIQAMNRGEVHYTLPRGMEELRQAIGNELHDRHKVSYDPANEIMVTVGCVEGITCLLLTVLDPGDEVLVPSPMYPFYWGWAEFLGGRTVEAPLSRENGYQITEATLKKAITPKTKVMIINTPSNPTGVCQGAAGLEAAAKVAKEHDLLVISDEIYGRITYDGVEHISLTSLPGMKERTVLTTSFSKAFAMDGWRVGYLAGPAELVKDMDNAHLRASTCASIISQHGALEALRLGDELVAPMRERLQKRRDLIFDMVDQAPGLSAVKPKGAFYLWLEYGDVGMSDMDLTLYLLEKAQVAGISGSAFGDSVKRGMRLSYATDRKTIEKGMKRLISAFQNL